MFMKKQYRKPVLKTRKMDLGVFGDYSDQGPGGRNSDQGPVRIIEDLNLKME